MAIFNSYVNLPEGSRRLMFIAMTFNFRDRTWCHQEKKVGFVGKILGPKNGRCHHRLLVKNSSKRAYVQFGTYVHIISYAWKKVTFCESCVLFWTRFFSFDSSLKAICHLTVMEPQFGRLPWDTWPRDHGSRQVLSVTTMVNIQKTIENGHRNSEFSHEKWWFSIVM